MRVKMAQPLPFILSLTVLQLLKTASRLIYFKKTLMIVSLIVF